MVEIKRLQDALRRARDDLLGMRCASGHWEGHLASSALSTATALSALSIVSNDQTHAIQTLGHQDVGAHLEGAIGWLIPRQNSDGGWGDTEKSYSNISTTMLVIAALTLARAQDKHRATMTRANEYVERQGGIPGLRQRYGRDKTFAIPILTNYALAGLVPWSHVSALPFELASLPQSLYRFLRLPVVSYAIPALVAVGQVRHAKLKPKNPILRWIRGAAIESSLRVLHKMQPASGGYLEAIPLTSFVVMSLVGAGRGDYPVVREGVKFLLDSVRDDGSWPIDTNLATWNTTLAINSLANAGDLKDVHCWDWILSCQKTARHPFTGADPGGWGWTDLSGAVPDADDTPGALLALRHRFEQLKQESADRSTILQAARAGVTWLLSMQNRDGGWPTFCRGWGALPFDRSGTDLTAHAIRALHAWNHETPGVAEAAIERGFNYLTRQQLGDGSWYPLWFGNQDHPQEENPVYGTAKVLLAYRDLDRLHVAPARSALRWLRSSQLPDGGWNAGLRACQDVDTSPAFTLGIVEETALAVEALLADNSGSSFEAAGRGLQWLAEAVDQGRHQDPSPIGFYFAKLWYYEQLYPLVFTVSALGCAVRSASMPRSSQK